MSSHRSRCLQRSIAALFALAALVGARPSAAQKTTPARADAAQQVRDRIRLYLRQHGDNGKIDAESFRRRAKDAVRAYVNQPTVIGGSTWVSLGPTNGAGRMTAIAPHPATAGTLWVGAAGGGLWKTTDGGATWAALTDAITDLSVGAVAVAPSSPSTVYVGSGEGGYGPDFIPGIGFLRSTDDGTTWTIPSSVVASTFYRISVHPTNPLDVVIGTNQGGLRSTDGGITWANVIARGTYGDVADLVRDPSNPLILYAAAWGGAAGGSLVSQVLKSTDGGTTWAVKSTGLPGALAVGSYAYEERMSIAISATNPQVLYAATSLRDSVTNDAISHVYKSTDGAGTWSDLTAVSTSTTYDVQHFLTTQAWYDNVLAVSPADANVVIAAGTYYIRSTDGGVSFTETTGPHADVHDLRYQGSTLYVANDGGIWSSADDAATFTAHNTGLVTRQFNALAIDAVNRNRIFAGAQDNGVGERPDAGGTVWTTPEPATPLRNGDGFDCAINPVAPSVAYVSLQYSALYRTKDAGDSPATFSPITPPFPVAEFLPYQSVLAVDPGKPSTIYTATDRVWQSVDGGDTWAPLSTSMASGPPWSNFAVSSVAVARTDGNIIMAAQGTSVFRSTDAGATWTGATLPHSVNNLEIDRVNPSLVYAAVATTAGPSLFQSTDGGLTWGARAGGLPSFAAQVVRVDPTDANTLYCGTDVGVYRSTDQGITWARFGTGIPNSSIADLRVADDGTMLRAATHGRGVWELQIPAGTNTPPVATITSPAGAQSVAKGASVAFAGSVSDPNGDPVTGLWTLPDTWQTIATAAGASSFDHTFSRAGIFPVSLTARDSSGALGSASVTISVAEASDACATPLVVPGAGPFPYTMLVNNEAATTQASDPAPSCKPNSTTHSLWVEFTPSASGTYEISTCGGNVDTVVSVFTGASCGPFTEVACNDDAPVGSICQYTRSSLVTVAGTAGQALRIQVTGYSPSDVGTFPLTIRPTSTPDTTPRVTGLSVPTGPTTGGTSVVVYGASFQAGATVRFGSVAASNVTLLDSTMLSVTTPPQAAATVNVTVTNPDNASGTLVDAFTYQGGAPPAFTRFYTIAPCRLLDSRNPSGPDAASPALSAGQTRSFVVANKCGVPATAKALALNLTAVAPAAGGYFTLFAGNLSSAPGNSSLNFKAGQTRANNTITGLATDGSGSVKLFNGSGGTANFLLDVNGYFQ